MDRPHAPESTLFLRVIIGRLLMHGKLLVAFGQYILELVEDNVSLNLCIVDTPGFGDELNREHK